MMFLSFFKIGMMFWWIVLLVGFGFCYFVIVIVFIKLVFFICFRVFVVDELLEVDIFYFEVYL